MSMCDAGVSDPVETKGPRVTRMCSSGTNWGLPPLGVLLCIRTCILIYMAHGPLGPWAPYPILSWANSPVAHGPKSPWTLVPKSAGAHGPMGPRAQGPRCSWGHEPVSRRAHGRMSPWAHSPRSITWLLGCTLGPMAQMCPLVQRLLGPWTLGPMGPISHIVMG